ncbi:MAG: EpsI family protein [Myxococcota bacterium]|nr:EpsI family protein [Myxococcota bacterium]
MTEKMQTIAIAIGLTVVAAFAWWAQVRPGLDVDASALATLPREIGKWQSVDIPLEDTVEAMLRADFNLQRIYQHPLGHRVELYVGYYGTDRGGRPEHTPWICYPSGGWEILSSQVLWVDESQGIRANEMTVEKGGERHLVQFWYRSHRSPSLVNGLDQVLDRLVSHATGRRADGALIRISTPIALDEVSARTRLIAFGSTLEGLIGTRWPSEEPSRS